MLRWFLDYWQLVMTLLSGPAGIIFGVVGALSDTPGKAIGFWVAGYICMAIASLALIHRMYMRLRELEAGGLTVERRRLAQEKLRQLSNGEREGLRLLLIEHRLTGDQVREKVPDGVDFVRINRDTPFLVLEPVLIDIGHYTDSWSIRPEWQAVLVSLLIAPQRWSWVARGVRCLLRIKRAFTCEGRRYRTAVRRTRRTRA